MPTEFERSLIMALESCRLQPASSEKSFIRSLRKLHVDTELSEKQAAWLRAIAWRYRKQLLTKNIAVPESWKVESAKHKEASFEDNQKLAAWIKGAKGD